MSKRTFKLSTIKLYLFVMAIVVVTRSFSTRIFPSSGFERILIVAVTVLPILKVKLRINFLDALWAITGIIILVHHDSMYSGLYITIYICVLMSRIFLKKRLYDVEILLKILIVFSLVTSIVTWISVIARPIYINFIVPFINESGQSEVISELNVGNLAGLTNHYSRNAYYVVAGIIILMSDIWSENDKRMKSSKNIKWALVVFEITTLLAIGKRGHTVFLLLTLYLAYMVLQQTFTKQFFNSIRAIIIVIIAAILIFRFVPAAQHILERFIAESASEDVSNGRFTNYAIAFNLFKAHPIFGIGYGGFSGLTARGLTQDRFAGVHNDYIQFLCETGIVGFVFFIGLGIHSMVVATISLRKIIKNYDVDKRIKKLAIWTFMFQIFVLMYSLTGLPHFDFEINTVYIIACAVSNVIFTQRKGVSLGDNL